MRPLALVFLLATFFSCSSIARAETGTDLLAADWADRQALNLDSSLSLQPWSHASDSGQRVRLATLHSDLRWRPWPTWDATPAAGYSLTSLRLRSLDPRLPRDLVDLSFGIAGPVLKVGDWVVLAGAGVGFSGNPSLDDQRARYGLGTLLLARQFSKQSSLILGLDYDGHRTLLPDVPIPVVAYSGDCGTSLSYVIGFPANSLTWRIGTQFTAELDAQLPADIEAHLRYRVVPSATLEASYTSTEYAFHLNGEVANRRLFFEQRLVELSANWRPSSPVEITVGTGYAFGQRFSRGFDDRDSVAFETLGEGPQFRFAMSIHF